jgi:hypothetical protein
MFVTGIPSHPMPSWLTRRIPPPAPLTSKEIKSAILILAFHLHNYGIDYGIIGPSAIEHYTSLLSLPYRTPTSIAIIIHPDLISTPQITATDLSAHLCSENSSSNFSSRKDPKTGNSIPRIAVKRGARHVFVDLEIFDHYEWAYRRKQYDLRLEENGIVGFQMRERDKFQVYFLNEKWLLRNGITEWNESRKETERDDIITLCDILKRKGLKLKIKDQKGEHGLWAFKRELEKMHDWRLLKGAIDCPSVLGPFVLRKDFKWTAIWLAVLVLPVVVDLLWSEECCALEGYLIYCCLIECWVT